jgi:hypothetical protein
MLTALRDAGLCASAPKRGASRPSNDCVMIASIGKNRRVAEVWNTILLPHHIRGG